MAEPATVYYDSDLAYIHDAGYGGVAQAAAGLLLGFLRRGGTAGGRVVDLGCGSGALAGPLAAAGYDVLGIDQSAAMVSLARSRVPGTEFRTGSFLTAELPACVAVAAVGEIFSYLFDRVNSPRRLAGVFRRVHAALQPGGWFLFDVAAPGRVPGDGPVKNYREGPDWAVLVRSEEDRRRQLLTRHITSFRRVGELYRRSEEVHRQRLYRSAELAAVLRKIGFRVRTLAGYGELRFGRGQVGLVARKPERGA